MPKGPPKDVKKMRDYSSPPKTMSDISACLKAHFQGYIEWEGINGLLSQLPVKFQQVVNIYYGEWPKRTIEETAEIMGCNPWTVKDYLKKAREGLLELCE